MKLKTIESIEILLGVIFICAYFVSHFNLINPDWVIAISFVLAAMYFPFGFYTLKLVKCDIPFSIFFGAIFALSLVAISLSLKHSIVSVLLLVALPVFFIIIAGWQAMIFYLFTKNERFQILFYDKWLTVRYIVLLLIMLYAVFTYDFRVNM